MDERIQAAVELKEISMLQQRKKLLAAEEREVEELRLLVESKALWGQEGCRHFGG